MEKNEVKRIPGKVEIEYNWTVGRTATKFFKELKENKKILGSRCTKCKKVYIPPREYCPECFEKTDWKELSDKGTVQTFTVVHYTFPHQPLKPPYVLGIVKLDGADTGISHLIGGVDFDKIKVGMRVQAVWEDKREGKMQDIRYFKPMK